MEQYYCPTANSTYLLQLICQHHACHSTMNMCRWSWCLLKYCWYRFAFKRLKQAVPDTAQIRPQILNSHPHPCQNEAWRSSFLGSPHKILYKGKLEMWRLQPGPHSTFPISVYTSHMHIQCGFIPRPLPDLFHTRSSPRLPDKIWKWPRKEATYSMIYNFYPTWYTLMLSKSTLILLTKDSDSWMEPLVFSFTSPLLSTWWT